MGAVRRLMLVLLALMAFSAACAGDDAATTPTSVVATTLQSDADTSCAKPGIVRPNCGKAPEDAGERGGALQITVWALLVIGLGIIFTVVIRSALRTERAKQEAVGDRNWS